jgi:ABC-type ATPase with predicted acetyltransferase domain
MMRIINIQHAVRAAPPRRSQRVLALASMFGVGIDDEARLTLVPATDIPLPEGGIVFVTGPSGGGKSTVLSLLAEAAADREMPVLRAADVPLGSRRAIIDLCGHSVEDAASRLARAGLGDAFVMLRPPGQLSDGQRARFRLARLLDAADRLGDPALLVVDEFGATLDRPTARAVAGTMRHWIRDTPHTLLCASAHDDLLEPLAPDVLVFKGPGPMIEVVAR